MSDVSRWSVVITSLKSHINVALLCLVFISVNLLQVFLYVEYRLVHILSVYYVYCFLSSFLIFFFHIFEFSSFPLVFFSFSSFPLIRASFSSFSIYKKCSGFLMYDNVCVFDFSIPFSERSYYSIG